jgi:hypothetical protein
MRQITRDIVQAFESRNELRIDNSRTDGQSLWLFNNRIADWRADGLWITNSGWTSATTKERLNGLRGVHIQQVRGNWFLNGRAWDGEWINVDAWNDGITYVNEASPREAVVQEPEFDVTSEWMREGYSRPVYSVYHTLVEEGLRAVEILLNDVGIPTKRMESDTEGVYRPNYFIVVRPDDVDKAVEKLSEYYCLA